MKGQCMMNHVMCLFFCCVKVHFDLHRTNTAMAVSYLQEVSHEVIDGDPSIQPFFLTTNYGSFLEGERQRTQVFSETCHDFVGLLCIHLTYCNAEKGTYLQILLETIWKIHLFGLCTVHMKPKRLARRQLATCDIQTESKGKEKSKRKVNLALFKGDKTLYIICVGQIKIIF